MHLWFYMFISHLQIYKNTEVETFKDLVWKWRSQVGHQSVHLPWAVSKLTPGRTPGHEVVPHIPCLAPLLVFTDMPRGECTLNMHCFTLSAIHTYQERLFISYTSCVSIIQPNVPYTVSKQPVTLAMWLLETAAFLLCDLLMLSTT